MPPHWPSFHVMSHDSCVLEKCFIQHAYVQDPVEAPWLMTRLPILLTMRTYTTANSRGCCKLSEKNTVPFLLSSPIHPVLGCNRMALALGSLRGAHQLTPLCRTAGARTKPRTIRCSAMQWGADRKNHRPRPQNVDGSFYVDHSCIGAYYT